MGLLGAYFCWGHFYFGLMGTLSFWNDMKIFLKLTEVDLDRILGAVQIKLTSRMQHLGNLH